MLSFSIMATDDTNTNYCYTGAEVQPKNDDTNESFFILEVRQNGVLRAFNEYMYRQQSVLRRLYRYSYC